MGVATMVCCLTKKRKGKFLKAWRKKNRKREQEKTEESKLFQFIKKIEIGGKNKKDIQTFINNKNFYENHQFHNRALKTNWR
mmetsp:Transcript_9956/g.7489  ORF Transcript_9956/g.7489 Transcript_9956/m.7489 type:complete len:82 (+) Transcript_9956:328-573(+)